MTPINRKEQSGKNVALVSLYIAHPKMPRLPGIWGKRRSRAGSRKPAGKERVSHGLEQMC